MSHENHDMYVLSSWEYKLDNHMQGIYGHGLPTADELPEVDFSSVYSVVKRSYLDSVKRLAVAMKADGLISAKAEAAVRTMNAPDRVCESYVDVQRNLQILGHNLRLLFGPDGP